MKSRRFTYPGLRHPKVLDALNAVPRHLFIPPESVSEAYADRAVPIGHGQTISQPMIVATMTDWIDPRPDATVLEIGTGSGFQAAVLSRLVRRVFTIERLDELQTRARSVLAELGVSNVEFRLGDGTVGWPEAAPFDAIIVTAATPEIPQAWLDQLAPGGRLVMPLGPLDGPQELVLVTRSPGQAAVVQNILPVKFVPLIN